MYKYIAAVSFLASSVAAHGAVTSYVIDGIAYPGYKGFSPDGKPVIQRPWPNYNTVEGGCTAAAMRCNLNGNTPAALSAPVKPGRCSFGCFVLFGRVTQLQSLKGVPFPLSGHNGLTSLPLSLCRFL